MKNVRTIFAKYKVLFVALLVVFSLPFFAIGDSYKELYVDADASGKEDGSKENPFDTISEAIALVDDNDGTKIYVAEGEYEDNFNIPEDAQVVGAGSDKVLIKADDDDDAVVYMEHGTKLFGVTVQDGNRGILIKDDSRAEINGVVVKDNDDEGIFIEGAGTHNDRFSAKIIDSVIKDNGRSGVYGEDREIIIIDTEIKDNDGNGITLSDKTKLWLEDTHIRNNDKSGLSYILDGSDVFVIDAEFEDNGREGVEINSYGDKGHTKIDNTNFEDNGRYGVARVQRTSSGNSWGDVVLNMNDFISNDKGELSHIVNIF